MNKRVTAVDWLRIEINKRGPKENNPPEWLQELYTQAKAMEKEYKNNLIDKIDYELMVIEDYAKGEVGEEITKLRSKLEECRNKIYGK
jgi:hypothetical protein